MRDEDGFNTSLRMTLQFSRNPQIIKVLAAAGADLSGSIDMALDSDMTMITALLEAGADPNGTEGFLPPLFSAFIYNEDPEIVTALLDAGADPDAKDHKGRVIREYYGAMTRTLFRESDGESDRRDTVYGILVRRMEGDFCRYWNSRIFFWYTRAADVSRCIKAGAKVNARRRYFYPTRPRGVLTYEETRYLRPLQGAAAWSLDPAVVKALLAAKDGGKYRTEGLRWAALYNENPAVVEALLDAGAKVNAPRHESGMTSLHFAALNENPAVVKALLKAGANLNARDERGNTPLIMAARDNENPAVVEALLDAGADPAAKSGAGNTPWYYVRKRDSFKGTEAYRRLNDGQFR